ncbi:MAG: T9SS C-terminal target domain-containing protein [Bacteroidetes bacterium]|nr:MAG: T9SS C-terminal target domain-containing protein [Bacteroidota bacterium]
MKFKCTLLFLCLHFIIIHDTVMAQPEDFPGCHFYKSQIPMIPLTESEIIELEQSAQRSDTADILHYGITIDATDFGGQTIIGTCEIRFTPKMDGLDHLPPLDLLELTVDSVEGFGSLLDFDFDGLFLSIPFPQTLNVGDTATLKIHYHGHPIPAAGGFGGFVFEGDIAYNLGIGLGENPYNFGRGWFPCFDNFVERATYDLNIISPPGKRAYCIGTFLSQTDFDDGSNLRQYRMSQPLPTYLVGVAIGPYAIAESTHTGAFGTVPVYLIGKPGDTTAIKNSFEQLGNAIDALEYWFGKYNWERVGYVMTNVGAMEHCTNIAYPVSVATNGPTPGQNRLMAHELAHHWWGNVLTLTSPADMWIKEGNAEYGAHLMTEYTFGHDYFIDVVKDNHLHEVLIAAHVDDGDFLPLSGIPYENTYGTHTYRKGASVMHNLRGYLGDSLFRSGMTAMLEHFKYQSIDAQDFRDFLSAETGVDLAPFFDAWIFNPGFSDFEISQMNVTPNGSEYDVDLQIQQKLRAAPAFHEQVPLEITFFGKNNQQMTFPFVAPGEWTDLHFTLPFQPLMQVLNDANKLNLARTQNRMVAHQTGSLSTDYSDFLTLQVFEMNDGDSAMINVVHHWVAPDAGPDVNPFELQLSGTHYWTFSGILPDQNFKMKGTVKYRGSQPHHLDYDLVNNTEDSLILVWRPTPDEVWVEYPHYRKQTLGSTDGSGFIRIDTLLMGEYAFANGEFPVAVSETPQVEHLSIFPNPSDGGVFIEGQLSKPQDGLRLEIFDLTGQSVWAKKSDAPIRQLREFADLSGLPGGAYFLKITTADGAPLAPPRKLMLF